MEQLATKSESALDNPELLFEATKFDDVELNQSEDLEKNIEHFFMFKLWIWSQLHRFAKRIDDKNTKDQKALPVPHHGPELRIL